VPWLRSNGRERRPKNEDRGTCLGCRRSGCTGRTQRLRIIRRWAGEHTADPFPRGILDCCRVNNGQSGRDVRDVVITITNFAYQGPVSISPGATVTVKNEDSQAHTVTSDQAGLFDAVVPGGGNVVFTAPTTAGSYAYHCTYHSNMHGTLVVK